MSEESGEQPKIAWEEIPFDPNDIPKDVPGTRKEATAKTEDIDFSEYRSVFEQLIPEIEQSPMVELYSAVTSHSGEFADKKYTVTFPSVRRGKHAFVGLVTITNPDGTAFPSVIKNDDSLVEEYLQLTSEKPETRDLLPQYYGSVDGWVVSERLYGLELQEVGWKLQQDPDFLEKYTDRVVETIVKSADIGVKLNDIAFIDGHNVIVDQDTALPRLIEQTNLVIYPDLTRNELITTQLFRELQLAGFRTPDTVPTMYTMKLMQKAFEHIDPQDIYLKGKYFSPTHPEYESRYFEHNGIALSDDEMDLRLDHPDEAVFLIPEYQREHTETFSTILLNALQQQDMEALETVLKEKRTTRFLKDKDDPRSQPLVLHGNE